MHRSIVSRFVLPLCLAGAAAAQGTPADQNETRLRRLEEENAKLKQRVDALDHEVERVQLGDLVPPVGESMYGLGPAASKVYAKKEGLSIGGYGEFQFTQRSGNTDVFDALRAVTYIGYKLSDSFVVNTELEFEHGTTGANSGTTTSAGSVSLEFGYLDWLWREEANVRAGLVLVPMGLINEMHEPTTFLSSNRPLTEQVILPSTWRELGAGGFGDLGGLSYRAYLLTALDGEDFTSSGLRNARQSGNRHAADDWAGVARLDWTGTPGLLVGGSIYGGNTGQDNLRGSVRIPDMFTTIFDLHADWKPGPFAFRALYAGAFVNDAGQFDRATGERVAERLAGYYGEAGVDVLALCECETRMSLTPFFRYEHIDTQATMPSGIPRDPGRRDDIYTVGLNWKPIDQVVLKVDFDFRSKADDQWNVLLGYVF